MGQVLRTGQAPPGHCTLFCCQAVAFRAKSTLHDHALTRGKVQNLDTF